MEPEQTTNINYPNPLIKDFALPKVTVKEEDAKGKRHTCSITFEAPSDVDEHSMMDYIMGIQDALGAKVVKFSWSLSQNNN
jgi:hypothetical protein